MPNQNPVHPRLMTFVSRILQLAAVFIFSTSTEVQAMGFLSKVMFSEVQGVLLKDGKPVPSARIKREYSWHWNDKEIFEETSTDASGRFRFPLATQFSIGSSLLPHEPVISQRITFSRDGQEYVLWNYFKHNYDDNGELYGKPIQIVCELSTKADFHIANSKVYGICRLQQ